MTNTDSTIPAEDTPLPFPVVPTGLYRLGILDVPDMYCVEGSPEQVRRRLESLGYQTSVEKNLLVRVSEEDFSTTLYCYPYECLGAALLHSTGTHAFTVFLKARARSQGLVLRLTGLYHGDNKIHGRTEKGIFQALCLPYVKPENRNVVGDWRRWRIPELQ